MRVDPLVTIVVPVYRTHIPYVEACVASVLRQTPGSAWELVIVDDGSGARYARRLERALGHAGTAGNVRFVRLGSHGGPAEARNVGASEGSGSYLLFLDSDDLLEPEAFEAITPLLLAGPGFVYADETVVSADARQVLYVRDKAIYDSLLQRFWGTAFDPLLHASFVEHPRIVRKGEFLALGGFRTDLGRGDEIDLDLRASERAGPAGMVLMPRKLYSYRHHTASMMRQRDLREEVVRTRERIFVEAARRRGLDVERSVRLGRATPTHAPHYALFDSAGERISVPYFDYDTLAIRPDYLGATAGISSERPRARRSGRGTSPQSRHSLQARRPACSRCARGRGPST
jgi:glycosyltransferase involved in cell wall biosynthesis